MQPTDIDDHMGTMEQAAELQKEEERLDRTVGSLIRKIQPVQDRVNELRDQRDALNQKVQDLIARGHKLQKKRDRLHSKIGVLKKKRGSHIAAIQRYAQYISEHKKLRNALNTVAHGQAENLLKQYDKFLDVLLHNDISLSEEKFRYQRVFEYKERYLAKCDADAVHESIDAAYHEIKSHEHSIETLNAKAKTLADKAQAAHDQAMEEFNRKDEVRDEAQSYHDRFVAELKQMKSIQTEIDANKRALRQVRNKRKKMGKKLGRIGRRRDMSQTIDQLAKAKAKMEKKQGLGLEDLRVLMDSGAIKTKKDSKRKRK